MAKKLSFNCVEMSKCRWVLNGDVLHIQVKGSQNANRPYGLALDIPVERIERSFPMTASMMLEWLNAGQTGAVKSRADTGRAYSRGLASVGDNAAGQRAILFARSADDEQVVRTACCSVDSDLLDWVENY